MKDAPLTRKEISDCEIFRKLWEATKDEYVKGGLPKPTLKYLERQTGIHINQLCALMKGRRPLNHASMRKVSMLWRIQPRVFGGWPADYEIKVQRKLLPPLKPKELNAMRRAIRTVGITERL